MIEPITHTRWQEAQVAEAAVATYTEANAYRATRLTFDYLNMVFDQYGKTITEVGCGPYPATSFVTDVQPVLVEPLWFAELEKLVGVIWLREPFEDADMIRSDECWLFNCLQHVRDPERVVARAKEVAPVVRFFEPVNYPTCVYHPHTFTEDDFVRWFGGVVRRYTDRLPGFFDADCCYGTWRRDA